MSGVWFLGYDGASYVDCSVVSGVLWCGICPMVYCLKCGGGFKYLVLKHLIHTSDAIMMVNASEAIISCENQRRASELDLI